MNALCAKSIATDSKNGSALRVEVTRPHAQLLKKHDRKDVHMYILCRFHSNKLNLGKHYVLSTLRNDGRMNASYRFDYFGIASVYYRNIIARFILNIFIFYVFIKLRSN